MQRVLAISFVDTLGTMLAAAASRVWQVLQAYSEARGRAAAQRELEHLSDHMLRDIGLYHGEYRR
jgi:uncharacterized protein YjiS (DUF1127 family)